MVRCVPVMRKTIAGRTMLEMIGVLAIIVVLTAGALWGFILAMDNYKYQNIIKDIDSITTNTISVLKSNPQDGLYSSAKLKDLGILNASNCVNSICTITKSPLLASNLIGVNETVNLQLVMEMDTPSICVKVLTHDFQKKFEVPVFITIYTLTNSQKETMLGDIIDAPLSKEKAKEMCSSAQGKNLATVINIMLFGKESPHGYSWYSLQ